ncbi:cytochrome P450 [Mycobacterium sp. NBC_00419]|uniref:cytochrome P450 n=1 Tax=Mycobacterium sp. NBC_00419 TaxID=2975989 RepID=UPI002E1D446C
MTKNLRSQCPVAWTEAHGGYWVVSRYEDVKDVARDDETFSSDNDTLGERSGYKGTAIPSAPMQLIPLEVDGPRFNQYRQLLNPLFSPRAADKWRPFIQQMADALIDQFCETGECDIVKDVASPVPAMLTMKLLGLPLADWEHVATPFHEISWAVPGSDMYQRAIEGIFAVLGQLSEELVKRRNAPEDDLLTFLVESTIDDKPLSEEEILKICFLMLIGGVDTTTGLLSHTYAWLSGHPSEARRLIAEPDLLKTATEEFLRWASPAPALARTVTTETVLGGQRLCPGDRLLLSWSSANQDESVFGNPDEVDLERWPNRHQAFGLGAHRCLGSNLGRVQFQEVLMATLRRLPDLTVNLTAAQRYPSLGQVNGYSTLPATFTPVEPVGAKLPLD